MYKKILTVLLLSSILVFSGCSSDKSEAPPENTNGSDKAASETMEKDSSKTESAEAGKEVDPNFGSTGASEAEDFTLEEMLTYAIQDEYLAKTEYLAIIEKFEVDRPFTNIEKSEATHITWLLPLIEKYEVKIPEIDPADYVVIPDTLKEAYKIGIDSEVNNIAMYETFLEKDLPDDVREVFVKLRDASKNHLEAFQTNYDRS